MYNLSYLPLVLYLAAIPLISAGTTVDRPGLTWIGFLALLSASLITPGLRMRDNADGGAPATDDEQSGDNK